MQKICFNYNQNLLIKKVDMAVANAIDRVMNELGSMRKDMHAIKDDLHKDMSSIRREFNTEIHALRRDMDNQFSSLKERVTAVESTLVYVRHSQTQISTKFIDYTFKAGWIILASSITYIAAHFFGIIG